MNIFIADIQGQIAQLREQESWHCAKVLRYRPGQAIKLIDGLGNYYDAVLESVHEKKCLAKLQGQPQQQPMPDYHLHLAIAPTKNIDRIEWMLEKAVEIGIQEVSFFISRNSERTVIKEDRMRTIVESAVKQSLQARIPLLHGLCSFREILGRNEDYMKFIAHCNEGPRIPVKQVRFSGSKSIVLIGPEGDFTAEEVNSAEQAGYKAISLGPNRLRTETAGLYVCQAASLLT